MKTEYKIVGLSIVLFVLVCTSDAVLESTASGGKTFWDSLIFNVSGHAVYLRTLVTLGFLVLGFVASRAFARQRRAEEALKGRSAKFVGSNSLLGKEISEREVLENELRKREERYRTVADFTYDWEFWLGLQGNFEWVSPSCERVTGYSAAEFLEDPGLFSRIIHPEDRSLVEKHLTEPLDIEQGCPQSLDFRIVNRNGEVLWINHVCQLVRGEGGKPLGRRASHRDITQRRRAEDALRESEERYKTLYEESKRSEELYRSLLNSSPDPIVIHDLHGHPQYVNDSFVQTFGWTMEELKGKSIPFVPDSEREATGEAVRRIMGDGEAVSRVESKRLTKKGNVLDVRLSASRFHDSSGSPAGMLVILRNITESKKAEEETRRIKSLLHSIIENLPTAVFLKDADGLRYSLWNRASENLYGYSSEELMGKSAYELFPARSAERITAQDRETLERGSLLEIAEHKIVTRHKGTRVIHTKKLPIFDDDGTPRYLVGISEDITEYKEAERALIQAREAAEQASRAKSEFLANMSHEIRTPINGIMGMTELALNTEVTPEQHEYLEAVRISSDSLLKVINDILDFSKIEAGKLELIAIEFGLRDVISDAMTILALQAHRKGLELTYDVPPEIPDAVIGDPGRLRQIFVNLVGNAIKFTEEGEVGLTVDMAAETSENIDLHFVVTDTGIGIPRDKQAKVFRAFEQADGSTSRTYGGTGLGLAISAQFINLMGGKIWVESNLGEGSSFHFVVKLGLQHGPVKWEIPQTSVKVHGLPVLVVDDNATNRRILEETFSYWGMKPVAVDSGSKAMDLLLEAWESGTPYPLVITDCMMPEMDGFQLVERIKEDPRMAASTIIMLTSSGERGDASRCIKLGISAYLVKPIKQSELLFTVSKVLEEPAPGVTHPSLITRHSIRESKNRLKILLAEDNPVNQTVALRMLERMGHTVSLVENGKEAIETLKLASFDLVLMDVQMPLMDGFEATRALREWEKTAGKHVPVIAMTAYALKGDEEKCLEAGMDGYIPKPISAQHLYDVIEGMMDQSEKLEEKPLVTVQKRGILDKQVILDRVGGDVELLKEIVDLFLQDYPPLVAQIKDALQEGDYQLLEKSAHTLKGSVGNFGADSVVQAALNLENMGRNKQMGEVPQFLTNLEKEIKRLREELVDFIKEIAR